VKQTVYSPKIWVPRAASRYLHARDSSARFLALEGTPSANAQGPGWRGGGRGVELSCRARAGEFGERPHARELLKDCRPCGTVHPFYEFSDDQECTPQNMLI